MRISYGVFSRVVMLLTSAALLIVAPAAAHAQLVKPPDPSTVKVSATASGAQLFSATCAACHQADGGGLAGQYPPLAGSEWVQGDEQRLIHIVLRGLTGEVEVAGETFKGEMPGWAPALSNGQVAAVLTYIRKSFGNSAPPVSSARVAQIRTNTALRKKPYTVQELATVKVLPK